MKSDRFYDFDAKLLNGDMVSMSTFKGKWVLIVNTASKCGLTPQYNDLERLYKKRGGSGNPGFSMQPIRRSGI